MSNITQQSVNEIVEKLRIITSLVNEESQPNINSLTIALREMTVVQLNIKNFGYEIARSLAENLPIRQGLEARHVDLASKPSTQSDIESDWVAYWASQLKIPVVFHRKIWEICYVMQALQNADFLKEGTRGLGFGVGSEPLPSLMASHGCEVVVTDLHPEDRDIAGWANTDTIQQHAENLDIVFNRDLVDRETFDKKVSLEYVNMNAIPEHLRDFDFCWSICALEHLGSIRNGLDFIENSMDVLRPGGVAVHTTEFNFTRDDITIDNWPTVLFQRGHFVEIHDRLVAKGYKVAPLDFNIGDKPLDKFIDVPPYNYDQGEALFDSYTSWGIPQAHLKISVDGIPATCFGIIITR